MRITLLIPILLVLFVAATGQQTPVTSPVLTKTDYLKKSKKQKNVAWVLLGGGNISINRYHHTKRRNHKP